MLPFQLFALGSNGSGQLGIGHRDDSSTPQSCIFDTSDLEDLDSTDSITKIVAGGNHTLVLCKSGAVFAAGSNIDGRCGWSLKVEWSDCFRRVVLRGDASDEGGRIRKFRDVAATWEASFFLVDRCKVYVCGSGRKGELGLGIENGTVAGPHTLDHLSVLIGGSTKVESVTGSVDHVVMTLSNGVVYGWGACRKGQLGEALRSEKVIVSPRQLELPFLATGAVLGRDFTCLFGDHGEYLLQGEVKKLQNDTGLKRIGKLGTRVAGWSTIYALSDGRVSACGPNNRSQMPPHDLPDIVVVAAGSEHCVALTSHETVIAWGWGEHGNCGASTDLYGNVSKRWNTLPVPLEASQHVQGVAAGCATTFVIASSTNPAGA